MRLIHRLSGFDERLIGGLDPAGVRLITIAHLWSLAGASLCGASCALLLLRCGSGWWAALLGGVVVVIAFLALQAHGHAALAVVPMGPEPQPVAQRRRRFVLAGMLAIPGLIFSQPLLLLTSASPGDEGPRADRSLRQQWQLARADQELGDVQIEVARLTELLRRHPKEPAGAADTVLASQASGGALTGSTGVVRRMALIVGNQNYRLAPALDGSLKDIADMQGALKRQGFTVTVLLDADRQAMELAVEDYARSLRPGDISYFHYSGHGFQSRGGNYLSPIDFAFGPAAAAPDAQAVSLVIEMISGRRPLANVIVVDACRRNIPGSGKEGLAPMAAGIGTFIAMASCPGQAATEPAGQEGRVNGLYTAAVLRHLEKPIDVDEMFRAVLVDVSASTKKLSNALVPQTVVMSNNLIGPVVLASAQPLGANSPADPAKAARIGGARQAGPAGSVPQGVRGTASALPQGTAQVELEPVMLASGEVVCGGSRTGPPEGRAERYAVCIQARLRQLQEDMRERASQSAAALPIEAGPVQSAGVSLVANAYRLRWSSPVLAALLSALLFALISGGVIWRACLHGIQDAYAVALHAAQREEITEHAEATWSAARGLPYAPKEEHLRSRLLGRLDAGPVEAGTLASNEALRAYLGAPAPAGAPASAG